MTRLPRFVRKSPRDQARAAGATIRSLFLRRSADRYEYPRISYPALGPSQVSGCRVFANRQDMVAALGIPEGKVVAEVGVAGGEFSAFLLECLRPSKFVAIDTFKISEVPDIGRPPEQLAMFGATAEGLFGGMTHLKFYARRFAKHGSQVVIEEGLSHECLARYPDRAFDLIYIDAAHDYESVKRDALVARDKIKSDGVLIFNDYIMFDHSQGVPYGVVQAVNQLVVEDNWQLVGFALHKSLFCDIAIRKAAKTV